MVMRHEALQTAAQASDHPDDLLLYGARGIRTVATATALQEHPGHVCNAIGIVNRRPHQSRQSAALGVVAFPFSRGEAAERLVERIATNGARQLARDERRRPGVRCSEQHVRGCYDRFEVLLVAVHQIAAEARRTTISHLVRQRAPVLVVQEELTVCVEKEVRKLPIPAAGEDSKERRVALEDGGVEKLVAKPIKVTTPPLRTCVKVALVAWAAHALKVQQLHAPVEAEPGSECAKWSAARRICRRLLFYSQPNDRTI